MNLLKSFREKSSFFRGKVARRIFLLFVLCALIPLSILAFFSYNQISKNLYSQANTNLRQASKATGMRMLERLQFVETDLDMIRAMPANGIMDLTGSLPPGLLERLRGRFKYLVLRTGKGKMESLVGRLSAIPQLTKVEQDHVHSGKTLVFTRVVEDRRAGVYLMKTLDPLRPSRALVFGEISPDYLWGGEGFVSAETELFVLDQSGNALFSTYPEYIPRNELKNALKNKPSSVSFAWRYGHDSYLAYYWPLVVPPQFHSIIVRSESENDILAPVGSFRRMFLLFIPLTFFIAVLISLIQIRRSLVPLELFREATKKIAAKQFESRVTIRTNDEFEELGRSFNEMSASLENYVRIMTTLNSIAIAVSAEKNSTRLLELILVGAKKITNADGCALYTVMGADKLRLSVVHSDSLNRTIDDGLALEIPLYDEAGKPNTRDAAVFSALNRATVNIPDMHYDTDHTGHLDLASNRYFDETLGYQTRSLLSVPVNDHENRIVGVLQLINSQDRLSREITAFSDEDQRLLETLASQATLALSKNKLIDDFQALVVKKEEEISARKAAEERLQYDALHDALTGLPNRALFIDRLSHAIMITRRRKDYFYAVLFVDLDRFKVINDSLGHVIGDQLLITLGQRLVTCLKYHDTVAHFGGDEFSILLEDISGIGNAIFIAERIETVMRAPFIVDGREVFATASIGIVLCAGEYEHPDQVLRDADTAMYRAKASGRAHYVIFEEGMHTHAVARLHLETDLRKAIDRNEFVVFYQPIISLTTNSIVGFEALVRWRHPERGLLNPIDFIRIADETGMIVSIDRLVLREACRQMQEWLVKYPRNGLSFISTNLSNKQMAQPDLVHYVAGVLKETGLNPNCLKLEITEDVIVENPEEMVAFLARLKALGVQLYIDDFGTGYSSLSYLHRLPIDGLKIDRSFIKNMGDRGENQEIIRMIMLLARDLHIGVIAEGVETMNQLGQIKALGCEYGQGYLFSKPVDRDSARVLLENGEIARA